MKLNEMLGNPKERPMTAQARSLRLLAGFMAIMLLCTLLSRAADAITMPQVTVEKPSSSAISHTVLADGVLQAGQETMVTIVSGILVERIDIGEGQPVEVGDAILTLNSGSLSKKLREENTALQKLRLELSSQQQSSEFSSAKEKLEYERANEDYSAAFNHSYKAYEDAQKARGEALQAMRDYYAKNKEVIDRWGGSLPPGVTSVSGEETIVLTYRRLQSEFEAADIMYEAARDSRKDGWKSAERKLEDAQLELEWNSDRQTEIMGLLLAMQEENIKELQRLEQDGGAVRATVDGIVTRVSVVAGSATGDSAVAMVAEGKDGLRFVAELSEDDMKYIERGASGAVSLKNGRPIKVTLNSIRGQTITAVLPAETGELGAHGSVEISQKTDNYPLCVPMSALRSDGVQKYVMILRNTETVMGEQLVAERVDVRLEDNSETRAAVSGALTNSDRVIVSSSKSVRAGDRVRLKQP